jgi:Na+-transporting methylmalonyl-CoA/oxaloacetate decarboxylase gamma subunit
MPREAYRRIVLVMALGIALLCLLLNLAMGADLLHAAFNALCVMLAGALILVHVMRWVGLVLSRFLQEQNRRPRLNGAATAADGESTAAGESARNG